MIENRPCVPSTPQMIANTEYHRPVLHTLALVSFHLVIRLLAQQKNISVAVHSVLSSVVIPETLALERPMQRAAGLPVQSNDAIDSNVSRDKDCLPCPPCSNAPSLCAAGRLSVNSIMSRRCS